jgi:heterotetrameric sarcosine oxidase gamma subunit
VAELSWVATSPLARSLVAGHHGANAGAAGVTFAEFRDFELVQVMARRGRWQAVADAAKAHFGALPPGRSQTVSANGSTLIWSGPDQFLALSPRQGGEALLAALRKAFAGCASLSDQSDGRVLLRISGPNARDALAKFCSLDLHPTTFPQGAAAATFIDHTNVNLWRGADDQQTPVFTLLVFSTFAESLLGTILDSAAEYGVEVSASTTYMAS